MRWSSSGSSAVVGSRAPTTSTYIATCSRAAARARARSSSTTVTAPSTMPTRSCDRRAQERDELGIGGAAELELVRVLAREGRKPRRPGADEERTSRRCRSYRSRATGRNREVLAGEPRVVAREKAADDFPRLANSGQRRRRVEGERLEPGTRGETEKCPAPGGAVEGGDLPGDLTGCNVKRV